MIKRRHSFGRFLSSQLPRFGNAGENDIRLEGQFVDDPHHLRFIRPQARAQIRIIRSETDLGWLDLKDEKRTAAVAKVQGQILEQVRQCVLKRECDILILDEITYPYSYGLIDRNTLKEMIQNKPRNMELVLTGRDADPFFMEQADYITEMKCISHPYEKGIDARRGIEF